MEFVFILIILALFLLGFVLMILLYKWLLKKGYRKLALLLPSHDHCCRRLWSLCVTASAG